MRVLKSTVAAAALLGGLTLLSGSPALAAAPNCVSSQMKLSIGRSNGAAGTIYYPIVFTNQGGTCVIWGVPAVQPVAGASHHAVGPTARNNSMGQMPARHTLKTGQSVYDAYGVGETGNYTPSRCGPRNASGVRVSLAGFVRPRYLALKISTCTKLASTHTQLLSPGAGA
jgi:Domain of unknown function (DUF4232)